MGKKRSSRFPVNLYVEKKRNRNVFYFQYKNTRKVTEEAPNVPDLLERAEFKIVLDQQLKLSEAKL